MWSILITVKYLIFIFTTFHLQLVAGSNNCDIFQERKNSYADVSVCNNSALLHDTRKDCFQICDSKHNCSAVIFDQLYASFNGCCLLYRNEPLLAGPGSLTIYNKRTPKHEIGSDNNPCNSNWTPPSGCNIPVPVTHVDFTNTSCIQTFNGASVVSYSMHFQTKPLLCFISCGVHRDKYEKDI